MAGKMAGKMADPIIIAGGSPQEILAGLVKLADYPVSKEQEYVMLKLLYNLTKYATLPEFLAACENHSGMGVTRKQMELIHPFVKVLSNIVW